jgi:CRP-like cAMP-binding protein
MASDSPAPRAASGNRLIDALPVADRRRLLALCRPVTFAPRDPVFRADGPLHHLLLPTAGVFSVLVRMDDGRAVEVSSIGREGVVGSPLVLGADRSPFEVFCQVPGHAHLLPAAAFAKEVAADATVARLARRFLLYQLAEAGQSAACNRLHSVVQRSARWLLTTGDRAGTDQFTLTHEFLSLLLGARRASVTQVAGRLQADGLIRYTRGQVTITDRPGLEAAACECYHTLRTASARLFD